METLAIVLAILFVGETLELQRVYTPYGAISSGLMFLAALAIGTYTAVV